MQESGREFRGFCKKFENELNQYLFSQANSSYFVASVCRLMELHLDEITVLRETSGQWLEAMAIPNRDEIAAIATKWIQNEYRLDHLDELLYQMHKDIDCYREKMAVLTKKISYL